MHHRPSPYSLLALAMDAGNGSFLDHVVSRANLRRAFRRVVGNRGAPGVDGMTVDQLAAAWPRIKSDISRQVAAGTYWPSAIRRHEVPKAGGPGVRVLGIPTVMDRVVQQAIAQPLGALLDAGFSPFSFGFRPGRSAHDALLQARHFVANGRPWILHLDLERFFDVASHDLVLARLAECVHGERLSALVRRCLTAPFAGGDHLVPRLQGLPQGSPLSPLLANVLLDGLDRRLFDAGFSFCRYADGFLLIDDLVDTGKTAQIVRQMLPKAYFATLYAKPAGRPFVDMCVKEFKQNKWIYFPWDIDYRFAKPIRDGGRAGGARQPV